MRRVDVIVPVFNAYEELVRCAESLRRHPTPGSRVIFVEDCSTDARVLPFLERLAGEGQGAFVLLKNKENAGFSASVNKGIAHSEENDVVLLNSDTILTAGWLTKLQACAYARRENATATPLSNNATLCSVPRFCEENPLPPGMTVDSFGALVERVSLKKYPAIPVGVGFCLYIKRAALREVGLFDAAAFGRGYGEENDWCMRAAQLGYTHALCDDTFVYHSGGASFPEKLRQELLARSGKRLAGQDEGFVEGMYSFMQQNPIAFVQENITLALRLQNGRPTVLEYLHLDFREGTKNALGGTQLHVRDLVEKLRDRLNFLVVAKEDDSLLVTAYVGEEEIPFQFPVPPLAGMGAFTSERYAHLMSQLLPAFGVGLVHVHHVFGQTFDIYYEAHRLGVPILSTQHDYYFVCPSHNMLNAEDRYCVGIRDEAMCRACLQKRFGLAAGFRQVWTQRIAQVLALCGRVLVPSHSAGEILCGEYPALREKLLVLPHGSDAPPPPGGPGHAPGKELHAAFVGGISPVKGSKIAYDLIVGNKNKAIRFSIFGLIGDSALGYLERRDLYKHGAYKREEISPLLREKGVDVVLILSIWPETFCYTLSEALLAGVPVVVLDYGALGERVRELDCGWTVPPGAAPAEILALLERIRTSPQEYAQKVQNIRSRHLKTTAEMAGEYLKLYEEMLAPPPAAPYSAAEIYKGYGLAAGRDGDADETVLLALQALRRENELIKSSLGYRVVVAFRRMPIPFKKQLHALVVGVYRVMRRLGMIK